MKKKLKDDLEKRIKKIDRQLYVLLDDRLDETISKEEYKTKKIELKKMRKNCEDELKSISVDLSKNYKDAEKIINAIRDFTSTYKDGDSIEKIALLRKMVNWIRFDGEQANIEWKKPFDILLSADTKVIYHPVAMKTADNILLLRVADGI